MLNLTIEKTTLNKENEYQLRSLFKLSWPLSNWKDNLPFKNKDEVFVATSDEMVEIQRKGQQPTKEKRIVGFCMAHFETPTPKTPETKGSYMYNLCVSKDYRNQGIASKLLAFLVKEHLVCYLHMPNDHHLLGWVTRHGWQEVGSAIDGMIEYAYGLPLVKQPKKLEKTDHYDPVDNVVYL